MTRRSRTRWAGWSAPRRSPGWVATGCGRSRSAGLVAAAFTHRTSRAGDPDLHTHVAVSNKVQTLDGRWRALDGRVLFKATVAASERYNTRLEAELRARLGLRFADRAPAGKAAGRRPVRELAGIDERLLAGVVAAPRADRRRPGGVDGGVRGRARPPPDPGRGDRAGAARHPRHPPGQAPAAGRSGAAHPVARRSRRSARRTGAGRHARRPSPVRQPLRPRRHHGRRHPGRGSGSSRSPAR